jgi:hypothetical protein
MLMEKEGKEMQVRKRQNEGRTKVEVKDMKEKILVDIQRAFSLVLNE